MLKGIFDTHAHMDDPRFSDRLDDIMKSQKDAGVVGIITSGSEIPSSLRSCALADKYDFIYASVGVYPNETANVPADYLSSLRKMCENKKVVAIGEIGMDYGYEYHPDPRTQEKYFREQLELACELGLPVAIHDRDADEGVLRILKDYNIKGEIHRVFSPVKYAEKFLEYGLYMGVGPQVTYPDSEKLVELVKIMPLDRLLLETDAPFLAPAHIAGQDAYPDMISFVAEKISQIRKDVSPQEVVDIALANTKKLYSLK